MRPASQRRRNGLMVRPNVDGRYLDHADAFCKSGRDWVPGVAGDFLNLPLDNMCYVAYTLYHDQSCGTCPATASRESP